MKKIITFICISLFFTYAAHSQRNKESWKKIKALKIAYLTEQLNLTVTEAEKFWPIYNTYDRKQGELKNSYRKTLRKKLKKDTINENEAKTLIYLKLSIDKEIYESEKVFIENIKGILPYKKIIKLQLAEIEFGRKLMRKYKRKKPNPKE